jgi:hypothetical protein
LVVQNKYVEKQREIERKRRERSLIVRENIKLNIKGEKEK